MALIQACSLAKTTWDSPGLCSFGLFGSAVPNGRCIFAKSGLLDQYCVECLFSCIAHASKGLHLALCLLVIWAGLWRLEWQEPLLVWMCQCQLYKGVIQE